MQVKVLLAYSLNIYPFDSNQVYDNIYIFANKG